MNLQKHIDNLTKLYKILIRAYLKKVTRKYTKSKPLKVDDYVFLTDYQSNIIRSVRFELKYFYTEHGITYAGFNYKDIDIENINSISVLESLYYIVKKRKNDSRK